MRFYILVLQYINIDSLTIVSLLRTKTNFRLCFACVEKKMHTILICLHLTQTIYAELTHSL